MPKRKRKGEEEPYVEPLRTPDEPYKAPHSPEAEQAVLGSMLMEREAILKTMGMLEAGDFRDHAHQILYAEMEALYAAGIPVDSVTLLDRLGDRAENCGGQAYLIQLQDAAPTAYNIRQYARIVKERSNQRRQLVAIDSYVLRPDKERRLAAIEALEKSEEDKIEMVSADDLIAEEIEVEWLVEPIIPLGGVTILASDWEMGKSWLAVSLCHAVANGFRHWLDSKYLPIRTRGGALYIDAEMGEAGMRDRVLLLDKGHDIETTVAAGNGNGDGTVEWDGQGLFDDDEEASGTPEEEKKQRPFYFAFFPPLDLGPQVGALEAEIRQTGAKVVVFDSLGELCPPGANPNSDGDVRRMLKPLKRLAAKCKIAIVLIHHLRKPQEMGDNSPESRLLGSQAFGAGPDSAIALVGRRDGDKAVQHMKARLTKRRLPAFKLGWHGNEQGEGLVLTNDGVLDTPGDEKLDLAKERILAAMAAGVRRRQDLIEAAQGTDDNGDTVSARTASTALAALKKDGTVDSRRVEKEAHYYLV